MKFGPSLHLCLAFNLYLDIASNGVASKSLYDFFPKFDKENVKPMDAKINGTEPMNTKINDTEPMDIKPDDTEPMDNKPVLNRWISNQMISNQ